MFTDYNEFFDYYIGEVRRQVPNYETFLEMQDRFGNKNGYPFIHALMHVLTPKQIAEVETGIRNIIKIPKGVKLVYDRKIPTYSSGYNEDTKTVMITYPTVTYYFLQYPEILKAAMKHEMGHILNKDIFTPTERSHQNCTNICMDARINIHIPHEEMDRLTRCLFKFKNEPGFDYINAEKFYEKIMLPFVAGGYSWEIAHQHYHWFDKQGNQGQQPGQQGQPGQPGEGQPGEGQPGGEGGVPMPSDIEDIMEIFGDHPGEDGGGEEPGEEGGGGEEGGEEGGEDGGEQPGGKGGQPGDKTGKGGKGEKGKGEKGGKGEDGKGEDGKGEDGKGEDGKGGKGENGKEGTEKGEDGEPGKGGLVDETKAIREMIKLDKLIQKTITTLNILKEKL